MKIPIKAEYQVSPYKDEDIMPFGKHRGTPIGEVPSSYLLWWYDQNPTNFPRLAAYIRLKKTQLEEEAENEPRDRKFYEQ